jgi:hypothetical protein
MDILVKTLNFSPMKEILDYNRGKLCSCNIVLVGQVRKNDRKKKSRAGQRSVPRRSGKRRITAGRRSGPAAETRETPMGYNVDTIVIMPVNRSTSFIYWEVTEKLLVGRQKSLLGGPPQLTLKVFETDRRKEICSFPVKDRIGKHYVTYGNSFNPLVAEIGMLRGKRFTGLLRSSPVNVHQSRENAAGDELWMRKTRNTQTIVRVTDRESIKKNSGLRALIVQYYQAAGSFQPDPLSSWTLTKAPLSED